MLVLPFVPVTPIICMDFAGAPYQLTPSCASAARAERTRIHGASSGMECSQRTAAAPRCKAMGMNLCPSVA